MAQFIRDMKPIVLDDDEYGEEWEEYKVDEIGTKGRRKKVINQPS